MLLDTITNIAKRARHASQKLALLTSIEKNNALLAMAENIYAQKNIIKTANSKDLAAAKAANISGALLDRLILTDQRIENMAEGIIQISKLSDPSNTLLQETIRPNGLIIRKMRVPIGVIAIIYESRPNVTADVAALCFKTSNATILRGGTEAVHSNIAILQALTESLKKTAITPDAIQFIPTTDREAVRHLVQMPKYIDLVIPRGGESLINAITNMAHVPVIKHSKGICHTYVDENADPEMALRICENAKVQRPGVCNAMETLLIHKNIAKTFLPALIKQLEKYQVELRGDENARLISPDLRIATDADWETEYLDLILAIKVVENLDTAIEHINTYGSHHSDAIVSNSTIAQKRFLQEVDSAVVYINASTRFTDGSEFGMGAEIGISTDKLHARGPMGLEELMTYKYEVTGSGQIRT